MSSSPELTGLIARLASRFEVGNTKTGVEGQSDDALMADLNQSLNLSDLSRVGVLDTAFSLMCFTAPQVFDSVIDYSVNTIVAFLSSSVDCKVLRFGKAMVLQVGGSISASDCVGMMESCADALGKLNENGILSCSLLYAFLRVAVMTTHFRYTMQLTPILDVQPTDGRIHAISKLVYCMPKRISVESQDLQMRLLLWYLDSQNLIKDVSQVLQDAVGRPFICLSEELFEKMEWRSIIICLALSPVMFIETRALLHRWFLLTGLASVMELEVELVSKVSDLLSRPMWWGLSAEVGSKLPFSYAYFPFKHQLFRTLAQPLSCDRFLELVHKIEKSVSHTKRTIKHVATTNSMADHKSTWGMAMSFPNWFYLAALLLSGKSFNESYICLVNEDNQLLTSSCSAAAAWYIAWILYPVDESVSGHLAEKLENLSSTLTNKHSSSHDRRKLKKPRPNDNRDDTSCKYTCQSQTIQLWLEEFQDVKTIDIKNHVMFRRIILGILIGCSGSINEDGYELLLHYVATGTILWSTRSEHAGLTHRRWNYERIGKCSQKEAVAGACIIFNLADIAEKVSDSISETREIAVDFICKIKLKVVRYLLKCVKRLLQFEIDKNNDILFKDLQRRMLRWRHQGKDVFHGYKDLDDAINVITSKLS